MKFKEKNKKVKGKNLNKIEHNKLKTNIHGITLIALVITIIVLIILAGVSINLVLGENGIITKAQKAKENTELAQIEEQESLNTLVNYIENEGKIVIEGPVEGGSYDNPYIPTGFTHTEGEGTWNSGYVIRDELGNEFVWVPCVIDQSKVKEGDNVVTFERVLPSTTATTDPYYMYNKNNYTITGDENPASDIRTSVGTYGGFYIAAYEAGVPVDENGTEIAATLATTTQKARSVAGANTWTNITRTNAIAAASNMINTTDGVKSGLISGEAWDTTLKWMVNASENSANEPNAGYDIDSTGNGYYGQSSKTTTGQYPINNIYDMAGNVYEWTTENHTRNGDSYLVRRGGDYGSSGSSNAAAYRNSSGIYADGGIGFRVLLYKSV